MIAVVDYANHKLHSLGRSLVRPSPNTEPSTLQGVCIRLQIIFINNSFYIRFIFICLFLPCRIEAKCCMGDCSQPTVILPNGQRHFYCSAHNTDYGEVSAITDAVLSVSPSVDKDMCMDDNTDRIKCACDLLLVLGTSLKVNPVAGLADEVHWLCPRVLFNNEVVHVYGADKDEEDWTAAMRGDNGFRFNEDDNYRDVACIQPCDTGVTCFAKMLGWEAEMEELVARYRSANPLFAVNSSATVTV